MEGRQVEPDRTGPTQQSIALPHQPSRDRPHQASRRRVARNRPGSRWSSPATRQGFQCPIRRRVAVKRTRRPMGIALHRKRHWTPDGDRTWTKHFVPRNRRGQQLNCPGSFSLSTYGRPLAAERKFGVSELMIPKLPVQTFPVSAGLLEHKQRMGIAIWEYLWLLEHVTEDKPDGDGKFSGIVRYGQAISATEIANDLKQSLCVTQSNLRKLARDGYITRHLTSAGYSYIVTNSKKWIWKRTNGQPGETTELFADQESGSEESCRPPHVGRKLPMGARSEE